MSSRPIVRVRRAGRARLRPPSAVRPVSLCRNRRNEAVASSRDGNDVAGARTPVAERPPQGGDLDPEIAPIDHGVGPGASQQLFLADDLAGTVDQSDQEIERAAADPSGWSASSSSCRAGISRKGPNAITS